MIKNDGGQAFPVSDQGVHGSFGMTLRDYIAAKVLPAVVTATSAGVHYPRDMETIGIERAMAREAYLLADAMLKERYNG